MDDLTWLTAAYSWPSEAFWRYFELNVLRQHEFVHPILEIGCGNGAFSARVVEHIEEAVDINQAAVARSRGLGLYGRVRCLDAHELSGDSRDLATVYANCVFEHIPNLEGLISTVREILRPGGQLVVTVPLAQMNDYLFLNAAWYARWRQRQLAHVNLLSEGQWRELLIAAGFSEVRVVPYLLGSQIRFWDRLDWIGCLGVGRYRVGGALRYLGRMMPIRVRSALTARVAERLRRQVEEPNSGLPCAALIIAS